MSRPLRIQAPGLTYHITARGVRRTPIYLDDADRRRFLALLADVVARFALRCHAYCEMTNHYHLAITTTDANLSRAVRQLNGDYASWWNWRHRHVGHVFQGRFGAQVVQDDVHLVTVCRYIVRNPVRAGIVRLPEQWAWSSYRATIGMAPSPSFLDCDRLLEIVSPGNPVDGLKQFRRHVMAPDASEPLSRERILGDDAFVSQFRPCGRHHPEIVRGDARRRLEAIFEGAITRHARDAAIMTAFDERYTLSEIARYLGLHRSTIGKIVTRGARWRKSIGSRPDPSEGARPVTPSAGGARSRKKYQFAT